MPRNAQTERTYSGINVMLLWSSGMAAGYPTQRWLTFRQALSLGGNVRRGEKGTPVVYANRFTPEQERARASQAGEEARSIAFLKQYTVFNAAQCEGLPEDIAFEAPPPPPGMIEPKVEALIKEWQPDAIVVGLPLNMDGTRSEMSERAEKFARRLNGRFNLPVHTHDERLTTFEAKGQRLAQGQRGGYRERPVDALAAALLLEGWLEQNL